MKKQLGYSVVKSCVNHVNCVNSCRGPMRPSQRHCRPWFPLFAAGLGALVSLVSLFAPLSGPVAVAQAPGGESEGMIEARLGLEVSAAGEAGGGQRLGEMHLGSLRSGQTRAFTVNLPAGKCFVAAGYGGPGVQNIDVAVQVGRSVLARDADTGPAAVARWCSAGRAVRARFTVTAFRGQGQFAAALYSMDPAQAEAHAAELAGDTALDRLESLVERHGGGMRPVTVAVRESLVAGEQLERTVLLRPGRCYRVLAAAERGITDLDLTLLGPGGATLQRDASDDGTPTLGVLGPLCPAGVGEHRLILRVEAGEGAFAWQVFGNAPASGGSVNGRAPAATYRVGGTGSTYTSRQVRSAHGEHAGGFQPLTDFIEGTLRTGNTAEHRFRVTGGQCYVVLAAAVPSARDLDIEVRDPYGNERGADRGATATPHVRVCPRVAGSYVARVHMFQGYGAYGLQIFVGAP